MITDKNVLEAALVFKEEMRRNNKDFKFAKSKDVTKTYQFRWFRSFLVRCEKHYDLSPEESHEVIKCLISWAMGRKKVKLSASLLSRNDVIDIAVKRFENDIRNYEYAVAELKAMARLICDDFEEYLLKKKSRHGYPNIILMHADGRINNTFVALSRSCIRAIQKLDDKSDFPSMLELVKTRNKMISRVGVEKIKEIMGCEFNA